MQNPLGPVELSINLQASGTVFVVHSSAGAWSWWRWIHTVCCPFYTSETSNSQYGRARNKIFSKGEIGGTDRPGMPNWSDAKSSKGYKTKMMKIRSSSCWSHWGKLKERKKERKKRNEWKKGGKKGRKEGRKKERKREGKKEKKWRVKERKRRERKRRKREIKKCMFHQDEIIWKTTL